MTFKNPAYGANNPFFKAVFFKRLYGIFGTRWIEITAGVQQKTAGPVSKK